MRTLLDKDRRALDRLWEDIGYSLLHRPQSGHTPQSCLTKPLFIIAII